MISSQSFSQKILVCFAVKEEAVFFKKAIALEKNIFVLVTGMGARNAEAAFKSALQTEIPELVITSGFAGALNPSISLGEIVYDADENFPLVKNLEKSGLRAQFLFSNRVAVTAEEKARLWKGSGSDAVEMESEVIRKICRERNIPSATIRVISDEAEENLPLDFNELMTPEQNLSYAKLALALVRAPWKIPSLMKLQKRTSFAAEKLSNALVQVLGIQTLR